MYNPKYLNALSFTMNTSNKVEDTIVSCETPEQLDGAANMLTQWAVRVTLHAAKLYHDIFKLKHLNRAIGYYKAYRAYKSIVTERLNELMGVYTEQQGMLCSPKQE